MTMKTERQARILELVRRQGFLTIDALAGQIDAEPDTVRADINALCEQGELERYQGGASLPSSVENLAYTIRQTLYPAEKRRIAQEVARHIPDHASLFINIGTTTEEVAKALMNHQGLRVVTNNLHVASVMSRNPDFEVIVAGGIVRPRDQGIVGEATVDLVRQFTVDYGIIGISGIDDNGALVDFDYREVRVAQAIIENSRHVFLATDHSKFGRVAMVRLGHVSQLDALFTDRAPPPQMAKLLSAAAVKVHVAGEETTAAPA